MTGLAKVVGIPIGQAGAGVVHVDLPRLLGTRLLIQGNSGAGKSRLMRLLLERAFGHAQTIVLDPEGEYSTLREAFDFVLAGPGGEVPAHPAVAPQLARKLMELRTSAVIDLSELDRDAAREFVRDFCLGLVDLPRQLQRQVLVAIDEAHLFCPEKGHGEAVSTEAVVALMSRGRKRGLCGMLVTQRLSKLHKDAAAEANNIVIGRTWLDTDLTRARDVLGYSKAEGVDLRDLPAGTFRAVGPAFVRAGAGVFEFHADDPRTTHPEPGRLHTLKPPAPSKAIQQVAAQLAEIPREAEREAQGLEALQARVRALEQDLEDARAREPEPIAGTTVEIPIVGDDALEQLHAAVDSHARLAELVSGVGTDMQTQVRQLRELLGMVEERQGRMRAAALEAEISTTAPPPRAMPGPAVVRKAAIPPSVKGGRLAGGERRILTALAQYPAGRTKVQVAVLTGYAHNGGGFNNYLSALRSRGLLDGSGEALTITQAGLGELGEYERLPTGRRLLEHWKRQVGKAERLVLEQLAAVFPRQLSKEDLAAAAGYAPDGGGFNNALSRLRTLELISGRGTIGLSRELA